MIEFISILVLTFAVALIGLGLITLWLEQGRKRVHGIALAFVGLLTGAGYAFLGSRFSLTLFDRLVVRVDLPALMVTALSYTAGVLSGVAVAVGLFLWATGHFRQRVERSVAALVVSGIAVALITTIAAIVLSGQ